MHLHFRAPSLSSSLQVLTIVATITLMGCAELQEWAKRQDAQAMMRNGDYVAAASLLLPFPFNILVPSGVLVAGHIAATVLRTGEKPEPKKRRKPTEA
jgi:hypothetical protein